ncbi:MULTISPECIES: TetR/AcrR family transcriptional regulator [Micrococcales]|uniref:TetR/AcrR family transcriptional regulator n=1 Tax=Micrococcales TaxID=85006 RepID=UPI0009E7D4FF|nr:MULTISPECIES: TetR/AcrR family transcriptional regulator [Micrococcales]
MSLSHCPTGDLRHARRQATRQAILDAAEEIVVTAGLGSLTSRRLAERAGTSERTVFNHFSNLDDVILARVSSYLTRILDAPEVPVGIEPAELPQAIDHKFRASFSRPEADELFAGFLRLSICLTAEMLDLLGDHILRTLADVAKSFTADLKQKYPALDSAQGVPLQMYVFNLTTSIAFGLLHGVYRLNLFESGPGQTPEDGMTPCLNLQDNPNLHRFTLDTLREDLLWAFDQVAIGRPRI